ncbi:MAG: hypothetical protein WBD40_02160 [Tepidisphaeraceae bacterium]
MADSIATAADYADAIMTARRAKNTLFLLLLLILLAQLALFFLGRNDVLNFTGGAGATVEVPATTQPTTTASAIDPVWIAKLEYLVNLTAYLGIVLTIVLAVVLLLIVKIMLVGRLIGVARLTSAFIWTVVLAALLFPWQAFWPDNFDFKLPGALYTWDELVHRVKFRGELADSTVLFWARFVGFPVLALIILLSIQVRSRRGLQQALGEAHYDSTNAPLT